MQKKNLVKPLDQSVFKDWCGKYFYKYIMCSLQVSHVEWEHVR